MPILTLAFLAAVALNVLVRLVLSARQQRTVRRHRDEVPSAFAGSVNLEEHQKAADYTVDRLKVGQVDLLLDTGVLLALTLGGGLDLLNTWVARLSLGAVAHGALTLLALLLLSSLISLPIDLWRTFGVETRYGFNRMTPRLYVADLLRSLALSVVLGGPLIALVLALMQWSDRRWWLYAWIVWTAFSLAVAFFYPRFIAPLFNTFKPLEPGPMRDAVERIMSACGYATDGVSVMDGSRRSSHGNAYFTGFGAHKRIVLFDTLIDRLSPAQVEAVLAHELGHYRLHHIVRRLTLSFASALIGFAALGYAATRPDWFAALGVTTPNPALMLALFTMVVPVFLFPLSPLSGWLSRRDEYAADRYAALHAEAQELAAALVKLYRDNASTLTPDTWYSAWYYSHPSATARIAALHTLRT